MMTMCCLFLINGQILSMKLGTSILYNIFYSCTLQHQHTRSKGNPKYNVFLKAKLSRLYDDDKLGQFAIFFNFVLATLFNFQTDKARMHK